MCAGPQGARRPADGGLLTGPVRRRERGKAFVPEAGVLGNPWIRAAGTRQDSSHCLLWGFPTLLAALQGNSRSWNQMCINLTVGPAKARRLPASFVLLKILRYDYSYVHLVHSFTASISWSKNSIKRFSKLTPKLNQGLELSSKGTGTRTS